MVIGEATLEKKICKKCLCELDKWTSLGWTTASQAADVNVNVKMGCHRLQMAHSYRSIVGGALSAVWYCIRLDETEAVLLLAQAKALDVLATVPRGNPFMKPRFKPILRGANSRTREVRGRDCGNKVLKARCHRNTPCLPSWAGSSERRIERISRLTHAASKSSPGAIVAWCVVGLEARCSREKPKDLTSKHPAHLPSTSVS